jgi:hypothetical protein
VAPRKPHLNLLSLAWLVCSHTPLASVGHVSPDEGIKASKVAEYGLLSHGPLFALLRGCREAGISGKILSSHIRRSHTFSSHRFY